MGKKRSRGAGGGGGSGKTGTDRPLWTAEDFARRVEEMSARKKKRMEKKATGSNSAKEGGMDKHERAALLTHETVEKRNGLKLKLHITKTRRELEQLKERLQNWDPVEEAEKEKEAARKAAEAAAEAAANPTGIKKRKRRPGPETWKLRGAARPAWEVYDFDVRYVDPHVEAHNRAREKSKRCENILALYRGRFASDSVPNTTLCRKYLGLLMQLAHLLQEAKQFKGAREALLECIELEGEDMSSSITIARETLMRMYLNLKRWDAAYRLGAVRFTPDKDSSVWIRYSTALVAHNLNKDAEEVEKAMVAAIKANPLCAYYLAFLETFESVMEYTDELEEMEDLPESSLEEAIEYCSSEHSKSWKGSEASTILKQILLDAMRGVREDVTTNDVEWFERLNKMEEEFQASMAAAEINAMEAKLNRDQNLQQEENEEGGGTMETTDEGEETPPTTDDSMKLEEERESSNAEGSQDDGGKENGGLDEDGDEKDEDDNTESGNQDDKPSDVDLSMFIGMFRTAMEMLEESNQIIQLRESIGSTTTA